MVTLSSEFISNLKIPIDLFVKKKRKGGIRFTDSAGNIAYKIEPYRFTTESTRSQLVLDAFNNPLVCIDYNRNESWQAFRGNVSEEENLIFRVERKPGADSRTEFAIFPVGKIGEDSTDFKMKGSPFFRACTIYKGDSVVAQTSLMYKLGIQKVLVSRQRFRLTIFPGFDDHSVVVALSVIFFHGRRLWI